MESEGKIDDTQAAFTYGDKSFTARLKSEKDEKDEVTVEKHKIIAFLPRSLSDSSTEYVLLYVSVTRHEKGDDADSTPVEAATFLRSLRITDPPKDMLKDYASSDLSWLLPRRATTENTTNNEPQVTVIISTHSGSRSAEAVFKNLVKPLLSTLKLSSESYHILQTTSADNITDYTRTTILPNAAAGRPQTLLLLTGDGGPVDVLNALLASDASTRSTSYKKPTLALIPCGTGNALANSTGIVAASSATLGLSALLRGQPTPLPLFRATLPPGSVALDAHGQPVGAPGATTQPVHGAVVFSWCLHASLVADSDTPAYRAHGAARFAMAGKENLFPTAGGGPHVYRGCVEVRAAEDNGRWRAVGDEHAYVLLTLVARLEAAFCISPASRPMDGRVRLVRLPPMHDGGAGVMRVMEAAYKDGAHVGMDEVTYEEVDGLRLTMEEAEERWRRVCIDGKIFVVGKDGEVLVEREEEQIVDLVTI